MKEHLPDVLLTAGAGSVSYGAWLVHPAAGFIILGLCMAGMAYVIAQGSRK